MRPVKEPRDELRVEPAKQRTQTDKYVTILETGTNQTDVDFNAQSLLPMSSDHYKVGVDELIVSLSNLSMIENNNDILFEIRPLTRVGDVDDEGQTTLDMSHVIGPGAAAYEQAASYRFTCNRIYRNTLDVTNRLNEISGRVNLFMTERGFVNQNTVQNQHPAIDWCRPEPARQINAANEFRISIGTNGQLVFYGNQFFWANFFIHVPLEKYQAVVFGDDPYNSVAVDPMNANPDLGIRYDIADIVSHDPDNNVFDGHGHPNVGAGTALDDQIMLTWMTRSSFLADVNRIVAIELSTSLPIQNSPLIDHQSVPFSVTGSRGEVPDYALGRFHVNFQPKLSMDTSFNTTFETSIGPQVLTGTKSRVCYHHLRPQERITSMKVRLWARVRTFGQGRWYMKTIMCPVGALDYWSAKLHFITKQKHHY